MAFDPARVKSLFLEASDLPSPEERAAYLDRECAGEPDLRVRVEALLAAEERAGSVPEPEATGVFQLTSAETLAESEVSGSDAGLATLGATSADGKHGPLAEVPPVVARRGGFVPGQVIGGRYTLLEVLGEGGMGTVYRAEQSQPVKRQVALKLIKVGMDSRSVLARFDAERQALAMMDHPNIARVYDGGATDAGQPFFVMEFVQGVPITDYCDRYRLSVDARLQLFVAVCQAVQHAHQKGIIHRDLKPSNVMVTEVDGRPTPKVIDFGVAKATEANLTDQSLGDTGAIVGTPTYMSPEQADPSSMDIDTRTDVYALGVILYELLAGSPPLDASQFKRGALLEMLRMVREVDPSKPSTKVSTADALPNIAANRAIDPSQLKRALAGDLDWIVMKALEKDRTRRYETANGFGADILRHLASEPVLAAPPSRSYRLRKFVRKNRAGVIAASLVLLALLAGVAGTTLGLFEARRQETLANERAEGERLAKQKALDAAEGERLAKQKALDAAKEEKKAKETAEAVLGFVENNIFSAARPKGQQGGLGYDVKLADAIAAALPFIEKSFPDQPLTEARLRKSIGTSFMCLGRPEIAAKHYEASYTLYRRHLGPDHPDTLEGMNNVASSYYRLGRHADALKIFGETLALRKAKLGPDDPGTLSSMTNLATSYEATGRRVEALKLYEETLALIKVKLGPDHPETLTTMNNLAASYLGLGQLAEASKLFEETLALHKARLAPDHPHILVNMSNLAASYFRLGRHAEALKLYEETLAREKARLGPDHPSTLLTMNALATCYANAGRHAEALKLREELLALRKAKLGPNHAETIQSMGTLTKSYLAAGRVQEALALMAQFSIADPKDTMLSMKVATLQAWFGQDKELAATRKRVLANSDLTKDAGERAAKVCSLLSSADKAELEASIGLARRVVDLGKDNDWLDFFLMTLGMVEYRAGHFAEAEAALTAAMDRGKSRPHGDGRYNYFVDGTSSFFRAMSLFRQGKTDEARKLATEAAAKMKPLPRDEQDPLAGGADHDDLILWLAYKEAKALIGFDPPHAPTAPVAK